MMVGEQSLFTYYKTNADLVHAGYYALSELDEMLPFERQVYIQLHNDIIEERNKK